MDQKFKVGGFFILIHNQGPPCKPLPFSLEIFILFGGRVARVEYLKYGGPVVVASRG